MVFVYLRYPSFVFFSLIAQIFWWLFIVFLWSLCSWHDLTVSFLGAFCAVLCMPYREQTTVKLRRDGYMYLVEVLDVYKYELGKLTGEVAGLLTGDSSGQYLMPVLGVMWLEARFRCGVIVLEETLLCVTLKPR